MQEYRGIRIPQSLGEMISPQETALIVYDMQAGITGQISNGTEIVKNVGRVLDGARSAGIRTFFTRHMSLPKELMVALQVKMAMAEQRAETAEKMKTSSGEDDMVCQ